MSERASDPVARSADPALGEERGDVACSPAWGPFAGMYRPVGALAAAVYLGFLAAPIVDAALTPADTAAKALNICAAVAFAGGYACFAALWRRDFGGLKAVWLLAAMTAIATALTAGSGASWGFLFIYCAACAAFLRGERLAVGATGAAIALAGLAPALAGGNASISYGYLAAAAGTGVSSLLIRALAARNHQLRAARAELAGLAVSRERERFARDLHDLLGHSLSLIALKSELAGRLLALGTGDAAREVAEIEQIARRALGEVREAVGDYRRPTLEAEPRGARIALEAAGVALTLRRADGLQLAPEVEAVLAWGVREAATNLIRHSGARACTITVAADERFARLEVCDDGRGGEQRRSDGEDRQVAAARAVEAVGHGLQGLRERAATLGGRLWAGPEPGGGFRVALDLPRGGAAIADGADPRPAPPSAAGRQAAGLAGSRP